MIKISFSGFSGSGKTSLLTEVKKILSLKSKVEAADEVKHKNPFDDDQKSSFVSQFFYFSTQVNEENIKALTGADYLLCDQSLLDQWIYWNHLIRDKEMTPQLQEKHDIFHHLFHFWVKTYDLIFLIRMDLKELEKREFSNELKIADLDNVKRIEEVYKETVQDDNLKIIEIWNNNTIDESAHEIIKHISEYKVKENHEPSQNPDTPSE
jgi:deoxyadenosine/deoxycytidine kinase